MQFPRSNTQKNSDLIKITTRETFAQDVLEMSSTHGVLVDFWASWCAPCRQLTPLLEKQVQEGNNRFVLAKINVDEQPEIAQQMRIQSLPTVVAFVQGVPVDAFTGGVTPSELKAFLERVKSRMPKSIEDILTEAQDLRTKNKVSEAVQILIPILAQDPQNTIALSEMAHCYLALGEVQKAKEYYTLIPSSNIQEPQVKALKKALDVAERGQNAGDLQLLRDSLQQDSKDFDKRIALAQGLFSQAQPAEAINELFVILNEQGIAEGSKAREELLNFLEILGPSHSLAIAARKRLSRIIFT